MTNISDIISINNHHVQIKETGCCDVIDIPESWHPTSPLYYKATVFRNEDGDSGEIITVNPQVLLHLTHKDFYVNPQLLLQLTPNDYYS